MGEEPTNLEGIEDVEGHGLMEEGNRDRGQLADVEGHQLADDVEGHQLADDVEGHAMMEEGI